MNKLVFALLVLFSSCNQNAAALDSFQQPKTNASDEKFIADFPKSYTAFVATYGWNEEKDAPSPLYDESEAHIARFFQIIEKNPKYSSKIYDIAQDGRWQADAVNIFQTKALAYIKNHKGDFCTYLEKVRDAKKIKFIYYFLMDKPTATPNLIELSEKCSEENRKLLETAVKEYKAKTTSGKTGAASSGDLESFVPKGFVTIEKIATDYNGDGNQDVILIIAPNNEKTISIEESEKAGKKRQLVILKSKGNDEYVLDIKNENVIPCLKCNAPADSYSDLKVKNNEFRFTKISGYNSQVELTTFTFKYEQNEWLLTSISTSERSGITTEKQELKLSKKTKLTALDLSNFATYETGKINDADGYTNLREEKNATSKILEKIKSGTTIKILDNSGDWWRIKNNEKTGYVHKSKISV